MDNEIQEKEIDLKELIQLLLCKWWLVLIFTIVATGLSAYISLAVLTPMYESTSTLFIGKETGGFENFDVGFNELQVDNKLVSDYRELIKTRLVTEEVIRDIGLDITTDEFIKQLSISTIADSRFIHISFKDANPQLAKNITNKLSEVLVERASDIVGVKNVQIVDRAIAPERYVTPNVKMNIAVSGVIGFMLSIICIILISIFDNTVKKEEDIERLGLAVLGVVPKY